MSKTGISIEDLNKASTPPEPTAGADHSEPYKRIFKPLPDTADQIKKKLANDLLRGSQLGLCLNRFKQINEKLDGLQDGFYLIGARENAGKTALLCNLFLDTLESNQTTTDTEKPVYGLFFSLDDTKNTIYNRFITIISNGELFINQVAKPNLLKNYNGKDKHYNKAVETVLKMADKFSLFDSEDIQDIADISEYISEAKYQHPDKKIIVFIDSLFNLELSDDDQNHESRKQHILRAQQLKQISKVEKLPLVCTVELRKETTTKDTAGQKKVTPPTTSDIMESGKYAYNADLVFLLWYDKEQLDDLTNSERPFYKPVQVTLNYAKNKLSEYRGKHIINFKQVSSLMEVVEVTK